MKKIILFIFLLSALSIKAQNSNNDLWSEVSKTEQSKKNNDFPPTKFKVYKLNLIVLKEQLKKVPSSRININNSKIVLNFPNEKGVFRKYKIAEASVLSKELQEKHPQIKSYIGKSIDNSIIRFSISPYNGFKGIILNTTDAPTIINRIENNYQIFSEKDYPIKKSDFECEVIGEVENQTNNINKSTLVNGDLRLYRLALVSNGEYSQLVLDDLGVSSTSSDAVKKSAVLGHLNSLMTTVNSVFERDASITMQLISTNENLIFLDPATDGLGNYTSVALLNTNQQVCDNIIGNSNYDIAHLLTTGSGGVAALASVCNTTSKAKGTSGLSTYGSGIGQPFALQYKPLIHELGHQFSATHTFNSCDVADANTQTGVEPGEGVTIMGYSNSCWPGTESIQRHSDLFFHSVNIAQISNFIQNSGNCASIISTGNIPPTVNAGNNYTIPKSTPFKLEGTASDNDTSNLSYTWEQINPESAISPPTSVATEGPVFRRLPPTSEPIRYLPNLNTILNGQTANRWEVTPSVTRNLDFVFLVRDNDISGGETGADQMTVNVDENSGPFLITSNNTSTTWYSGSTQTLTWDVANTNTGLVNTPTVDILFSTNGGTSFPTILASNIPNNGIHSLEIPFGISTTNGRFLIKGHNNIFLDINDATITVEEKQFLINISNSEKEKDICLTNGNSISYNFTYNSYLGFNGNVTFSASNLNGTSITFSPSSTNTNGTNVTMTINNINTANIGQNIISITANSGSFSHSETIILNIFDNSLNTVSLVSPSNNANNVSEPFTFQWNTVNNANLYNIEISTNNTFTNIIENETISNNTFISTALNYDTTYYWHVKPINTCINGNFSSIYGFTTQSNHANDTYVPDDAFEQALIDLGYDSGALDNYVPTANINTVISLTLQDLGVADLTGIESFTALQTLNVRNYNMSSQLQTLDLSNNTQLRTVYAYYNNISSVNISNSSNLIILGLFDNQLSSIDVSNNPSLGFLDVARNNLTSIDVSQNGNL